MKTDKEWNKWKEFFNSQGYDLDDDDDLWMEEYISFEHKFKHIIDLMEEYANHRETNEGDKCKECGFAIAWSYDTPTQPTGEYPNDQNCTTCKYEWERGSESLEHGSFSMEGWEKPITDERIEGLWEKYSEHRRVSIDDIIGLTCMDESQFKEALKELTPLTGDKNTLIHFLDSIRAYEHEAGKSLSNDERESKEFVEIYLKDNPITPLTMPTKGEIKKMALKLYPEYEYGEVHNNSERRKAYKKGAKAIINLMKGGE